MADTKLPGGTVAAMDQLGALLNDLASILADYYSELIKQGMPEEIAKEIVLNLQRVFWTETIKF